MAQTPPGDPASLVELLTKGILLTTDRIQATLDDAVRRGRMTRDDAEDLARTLVGVGAPADRGAAARHRAAGRPLAGRGRGPPAARGRPRAARGRAAARFPIAGYDEPDRRRRSRSGWPTSAPRSCARCATTSAPIANRKSVLARDRARPSLLGVEASQTAARPPRPSMGAELELTIDSLAYGGNGVARLDGYVAVRRAARPRRPGPRRGDQAQAPLRRGAHGRGARARPRPHRAGRRPPGRAVAGAALRAPAGDQGRAGRRRAAAHRPARRLRARADRARRASSGATATSSSSPSAPTTGRRRCICGFHAPGRWERIVADGGLPAASERGNAARRAVLAWAARSGLTALRPPHARGPAAQPRRARGPAHRPAAGAPRHRPGAPTTRSTSSR